MPSTRHPLDQYLQKVGGTYYARVRVPRTLEQYVHQTHIRRSLKTGDKAMANRRKHAVVADLKGELEALRKKPGSAPERGLSFADAKAWRDDMKAADEVNDDGELKETIHDMVIEKAAEFEGLFGQEKARRWYKAATTTSDTLQELMDGWMQASDYKESTKAGHRKALAEVLGFLKNDHATPADVTRKVAMAYIDTDLTQRNLAHTTIRDRLVSLGGFWAWLASRDAVPAGVNPWTGHKVSKQSNKGRSPPKRTYTDAELLKLFAGNARVKGWPTYAYMPDLMVIGLFTGARIESLCALRCRNVELTKAQAVLTITNDKSAAGERPVGVVHPAPLAVINRRTAGKAPEDLLFPELTPGGLDKKLSSSPVKAYTRYRRTCDVPDGTDFHSFRRNVVTVLEAA
jgi:integrase